MRPFKDLKEFKENTGLDVGDVLPIRVKQDISPKELYFHKWLVTELNFSNKTVGLGTHIYPLEDLCKNFEFQKDNKWLPFGVEESNDCPAKFKVGKEYFYFNDDDWAVHVFVNAKYRDPADNKVKIVFENTNPREVYTDENGNEYITLYENAINSENAVKYEVNAEDEVEE